MLLLEVKKIPEATCTRKGEDLMSWKLEKLRPVTDLLITSRFIIGRRIQVSLSRWSPRDQWIKRYIGSYFNPPTFTPFLITPKLKSLGCHKGIIIN